LGGSVGISLHDDWSLISTRKYLRKGDLLYPMLINIVTYMLEILFGSKKVDGQVGVLISYLVERGVYPSICI
jgi:hypothetical protein